MRRGIVLPLSIDQVVTRALYLAGERPLSALDEWVRRDPTELRAWGYEQVDVRPVFCPDLYYLLEEHNGGKDPTAPDPAVRWSKPGATFQNRTVDCSGGNAWMHGHDRFVEQFPHYRDTVISQGRPFDGGWMNTDSKIIDATGAQRCWMPLRRPEPGCVIVCKSGSYGHRVGHEGTVVAVHCLEWDPTIAACWELVDVVDCAARAGRSNKKTTARGWRGTNAMFLRSVMTPVLP